jgi:4-hydroxybenzoate polyprenyltransferase
MKSKFATYTQLMRLDKPVGIWLLFLPCAWSISINTPAYGAKYFITILLFLLGSVLMRSAGCIVNDLFDRDIDRQVARTASRPLASGKIGTTEALILLAILLLLALVIILQFNFNTVIASFCALLLVIAYPLMKRITWWPQAFLGIVFNAGAIIGSLAITGEITSAAIFLYIGGVFWTLGYRGEIHFHKTRRENQASLMGVLWNSKRMLLFCHWL